MNKENLYRYILGGIILICLILLFIQNISSITGHATTGSTYSNVTISKALAINFCDNMVDGILFGDVSTLPATNINASHNYDGASNGSTLCILVSNDSNTNIDLCTKADTDLTNPENDEIIGLGNETYAHFESTNSTHPDLDLETSLTESYVQAGDNVVVGEAYYYRFWLDIPGAQPTGSYNNTVSFKGVSTGVAC
jgi:hypothetical protein